MLTSRRRSPRLAGGKNGGFTLIELMIVVAVMGIVLVIAGSALISLSQTTNRGGAMIRDEQNASTVLTQLAKDIRSSHCLSFPSGSTTADEILLQVNNPGGTSGSCPTAGPTTPVEWIYQPASATLTRELENGAGTFMPGGPSMSRVANPPSNPVFSYLNDQGTNISTSNDTTIANCTTRIRVLLVVAPPPGITGVSTFQVHEEVAITDQLTILSAPGNGQC